MSQTLAVLALTTLLLSPIAASAQAPVLAKATPQSISIQVTFVTVNTSDLDALGVNFNARLLPAAPETYLSCAEGNIVPQIYQMLTHTAHMSSHVVSLTPIKVPNNLPAVFAINAKVPIPTAVDATDQQFSFPQLTEALQIHGEITLIPQIVSGTLVRLDMLSPRDSSQKVPLYCISSGEQIVINASLNKMHYLNDPVQLKSSNGRNKVSHTTELLIFITPTILGADTNSDSITLTP